MPELPLVRCVSSSWKLSFTPYPPRSRMSTYTAEEGRPAGLTPAVQWLLIANVAVYFLQRTVVQPEMMATWFGFAPAQVVTRWWTPITYAFVHGDLLHILFNMIALWQFGPRVESLFGTKRFVWFYAWCALGGAALHALFVRDGMMIGASAAVMGIMYAFAHAWPRTMLLFFGVVPMRITWYIWGFALVSAFLGFTSQGAGVAHFAHLGGMLTAMVLVRLPSARKIEAWQDRFNPAPELPEDDPLRAVPRTSAVRPRAGEAADPIDDVVARSNAIVQRRSPVVAPPRPVASATVVPVVSATDELNALLDKMSMGGGREGLTEKEQERLKELSELLRGKS